MELKLSFKNLFHHFICLLIVPYGIEIGNLDDVPSVAAKLLIVPYGIEMVHAGKLLLSFFTLLIVPYGIEILEIGTRKRGFFLLIVPYGIEIFHHTFRRNTH